MQIEVLEDDVLSGPCDKRSTSSVESSSIQSTPTNSTNRFVLQKRTDTAYAEIQSFKGKCIFDMVATYFFYAQMVAINQRKLLMLYYIRL